MDIFFKEGITTLEQVKINMAISDMVNDGTTDSGIYLYLKDVYDFTELEAIEELKKAKLFMGWYARKD